MSAITGYVKQGGDNFVRNVTGMWDGMRLRDYIRIIIIVGAYLLLRPYIVKLAGKIQAKEIAKAKKSDAPEVKAKLSPNQLRDGICAADKQSQSVAVANNQEKGVVRRGEKSKKQKSSRNEEQEKAKPEPHGDKSILDHLVDYEEGKDGW